MGVKLIWNHTDSVSVLAASMGPNAVAKMAVTESTKVMRSRFHSGQFRGSLGSSDGWGIYGERAPSQKGEETCSRAQQRRLTKMMPSLSHFRPGGGPDEESTLCGLSGSS